MNDQVKNMMIGIFVICALAVVVFVMMFLHPNVGDEAEVIRVRFANIDKISEGTRVTFGGKPIGEVADIQEIPPGKDPRLARNGNVYIYELVLRIDSGVKVYVTDEFTSRTSGLLGEKSVAIIPRPVKPGEKLVPVGDKVMYATEVGSVEDTIREFKEVADKFDLALDNINDIFADIKKNKIVANLARVANNLGDITTSLNKPEQWEDILSNIHEVSVRATNSWDKVDESLDNITNASKDMKIVVSDVREGKGSIGKIVVNDDLYLRISSLLSKAEVALDDINHYGLLYQNDKGWQRLRARRLNLMQKLSSPQEFRNFFNDEIDQITAGISRVSMILNQIDPCCPCYDLWNNPDYVKVYGELIRRVDMLDEYVNMFNTQVVSQDVIRTELTPPARCCEQIMCPEYIYSP